MRDLRRGFLGVGAVRRRQRRQNSGAGEQERKKLEEKICGVLPEAAMRNFSIM